MPFESVPDDLVALRYPIGNGEQPLRRITDNSPDANALAGAAMRQGNFLVSAIASSESTYKPEPKYSPLNDIADTFYLTDYGDEFIGSRSHAQTQSIKARIDRELHDRETLAAGGWYGTVAGVGAGLIDPLNLVPGGAFFKAGRGAKMALSLAAGAAVGTAVQEAGLHATQTTRTLEESIWNIGGATILAGVMDAGAGVDRGPLVESAAQLAAAGNVCDVAALMAQNALERRASLVAASRATALPLSLAAVPMAGNCLAPMLCDGDIAVVDPFADIAPDDVMMFSTGGEGLHFAKVYLGTTNCPRLKAALGHDQPGKCAVLWMANPETFILVGLADLDYVARIDGRVDGTTYHPFGSWQFTDEQRAGIDHFGGSIVPARLEAFGSPPLTLVAV